MTFSDEQGSKNALQDMTAVLNKTKEQLARTMTKAALNAGMEIDLTTLTIAFRPNASIAFVTHQVKGDLDLDDEERNIGLVFVDLPNTGEVTDLPKGFYTLKVIGKPNSDIKQAVFINKRGSVVKKIPATIELIKSEDSDGTRATCTGDASIDHKKACVTGTCCTEGSVKLCARTSVCLVWG